ncbi:unnamed protein product [Meloidogyne enterolobii]|uniref:Uncharacterized protein n=1 Tax=Meloidogyne enterolobii TaxID=390850 RepID=A0ACB0Z8W7_MELEN
MDNNQPSSSKDPNIQWMYDGTKSIVNREDYLLGKKIDRNFELYSDVVVKDKDDETRDNFFKQKLLQNGSGNVHNQKISALDVRTVRNEDPLVALKFQEEQRRRQMLENPLIKLKAQRILQKEFEKQMKKVEKKKKKHKKSKRNSSSSDEEIFSKHGRVDEREKHRHSREERSRSRSRGRDERRREDARREEGHHHHHREVFSRSSDVNKTNDSRRFNHKGEEKPKERLQSRPKLSAAEIEERRKAMLQNASWRDEMRENNFKKTIEELRKEENEANNIPNFIRPIMDSANSSLEKRLQSNKMGVQRSHDHMDKSFLKR